MDIKIQAIFNSLRFILEDLQDYNKGNYRYVNDVKEIIRYFEEIENYIRVLEHEAADRKNK